MPRVRSLEKQKPTEKIHDIAGDREQLFASLIEAQHELSKIEMVAVVRYLAERSIEDGVDLLETLPPDLVDGVLLHNSPLIYKNQKLFTDVSKDVSRSHWTQYVEQSPFKDSIRKRVGFILQWGFPADFSTFGGFADVRKTIAKHTAQEPEPVSINAQRYLDKIDAHYARQLEYIALPEFKDTSTGTVGAKLAWTVVREYADMYNHSVHPNQVWKMLEDLLTDHLIAKDLDDREFKTREYIRELNPELLGLFAASITPDTMQTILDAIPHLSQARRAQFMKEFELNRLKPLDPVMKAAQQGAQTHILKDLETSLAARGIQKDAYEFVKDPITKTFEFKPKKKTLERTPALKGAEGLVVEEMPVGGHRYTNYGFAFNTGGQIWFHRGFLNKDPLITEQLNSIRELVMCHPYLTKVVVLTEKNELRLLGFDENENHINVLLQNNVKSAEDYGVEGSFGQLRTDRGYKIINFETNGFLDAGPEVGASGKCLYYSGGNRIYADGIRTEAFLRAFKGETVDIIEQGDDWLRIKYGDDSGIYIHGREFQDVELDVQGQYLKSFVFDDILVSVFYGYGELQIANITKQNNGVYKVNIKKISARIDDLAYGISGMTMRKPTSSDEFPECFFPQRQGGLVIDTRVNVHSGFSLGINKEFHTAHSNYVGWYRDDHLLVTKDSDKIAIKPDLKFDSFKFEQIGGHLFIETLDENDTPLEMWKIATLDNEGDGSPAEAHPVELEANEKTVLFLLNAALNPTRESVKECRSVFSGHEVNVGETKSFLATIKDVLRSAAHNIPLAKELFKTMAARTVSNNAHLEHRIVDLLIPQLKLARALYASSERTPSVPPNPASFAQFHSESAIGGGDPKEQKSTELLKLRESLDEFFATNVYSECHPESGVWRTPAHAFEIASELQEPVHEITATVKLHGAHGEITLPIIPGAQIIPSRVKGVDAFGHETPAPLKVANKQGSVVVQVPHGIDSVVYSVRRSLLPTVPRDISEKELQSLSRTWQRARVQHDSNVKPEAPIAQLPIECRAFIKSIDGLSPRERIEKIEAFVREKSYYDFDNKEVVASKKGVSNTERIAIMRARLSQIMREDPEKAKLLSGKIFSGVCADFSVLTAAMMQASGFVGGIMFGMRTSGTTATTNSAHTLNWVAWPSEKEGVYQVVLLDGTPSGTTPEEIEKLAGIQRESLVKQKTSAKDAAHRYDEEHAEEFEAIVRTLERMNPDEIKLLTNGKIEHAVNAVLTRETKHRDARVIEHVLNVLLYSPVSLERFDWTNIIDKSKVLGFVDEEVTRERLLDAGHPDTKAAGVRVMNAFTQFLEKYQRRYPGNTQEQAFSTIEHIFDGIRAQLDPVEYRVAIVVLTYLRARKMLPSTR